jgi:ATP-dependent Clp protease ATP-binding subunit ClpC
LPDKAIDVIDEAGSRVRMRTMTRPPDLKDLEREIEELNKEKEAAVAQQDFERAANLRDQADKLKKKKEQIKREWREQSSESGGVVDEEVVAETVSKMTGIPLTRLEKAESERLLTMEGELAKSVVSQGLGDPRDRSRRAKVPLGAQRPPATRGIVYLSWPHGRRQDARCESARQIHVRRG